MLLNSGEEGGEFVEGFYAVLWAVIVGGEGYLLGVDVAAVVDELYCCPSEAVWPKEILHGIISHVDEMPYIGI